MDALLIGATGATGTDLMQQLLQHSQCRSLTIFVRRLPAIEHPKLTIHLIDFDQPKTWSSLVRGSVLFSCLGTTLKAAGSQAAQWQIDYDYQYQFAKVAKANGVPCLVLVSAAQASPRSLFFYARMKGQLEAAVTKLNFRTLHIFRPPLLIRNNTDRSGERVAARLLRLLNRVGLLRSQRPLPTEELARAMIRVAEDTQAGTFIHEPGAIAAIN